MERHKKNITVGIGKVLKIIVFVAIFAGAYLFAVGSGANQAVALLVGLGAVAAGLFLVFLLAPFFSSLAVFLWFMVSSASFLLLLAFIFSQWNQSLAWNKQSTGFYLTAALAGLTVLYFSFYASIVFGAFLSVISSSFKKIIRRVIKR